jgi:hypothetical protein
LWDSYSGQYPSNFSKNSHFNVGKVVEPVQVLNSTGMKNVMKSIAVFFLMTLLVVTVQSQAIDIVNTKHDNLFVLRVDKELMGAQVEVLSADGNRVTAQRLKKRKMIIDFCDVKSGLYTIVVSKNDQQQKFEFVRK